MYKLQYAISFRAKSDYLAASQRLQSYSMFYWYFCYKQHTSSHGHWTANEFCTEALPPRFLKIFLRKSITCNAFFKLFIVVFRAIPVVRSLVIYASSQFIYFIISSRGQAKSSGRRIFQLSQVCNSNNYFTSLSIPYMHIYCTVLIFYQL